MSFLDILSGKSSADRKYQLDQAGKREDLLGRTLFETMTEDRQERRVREAAGTPGQFQLPADQEGPQIAGTGYFSDDPGEQMIAQILMANINSKAYGPMLTGAAGAPARYRQAMDVAGVQKPMKVGTVVNMKKGDQTVAMRYLGGDAALDESYKEVARGETFATQFQSEGAKLREKADFEYYRGIHGAADKFASTARDYEYINQVLQKVDTGTWDKAILVGQRFAQRLGATSFKDSIAAREAAESAFSNAVLNLMKPDSETGKRAMAGQSSNKELDFFKGIPPGLEKTASGRELISLVARIRAQRADQIAVRAFEAEERGLSADRFRAEVREDFKDLELPPRWRELLGLAEEELKTSGDDQEPQEVDELPSGFIDQGDGTAINPKTGEIARRK
jgi:hypothetical protein